VERFDPNRPDFSPYGFTCVRWTATRMPRSDRHNEIELNLLECGRLVYLMGGRKFTVHAGRLTVFWAGVPHQVLEFQDLTEYFVLTIPLVWFLQYRQNAALLGPMMNEMAAGVPREHLRPSKPTAPGLWRRFASSVAAVAVTEGMTSPEPVLMGFLAAICGENPSTYPPACPPCCSRRDQARTPWRTKTIERERSCICGAVHPVSPPAPGLPFTRH
jgi:hypothetical protein